MSIQSAIEEKLAAAFRPDSLEVVNESHLHAAVSYTHLTLPTIYSV